MTTSVLIEEVVQHLEKIFSGQYVERIETHISWVLLVDQWAFKLKKPLANPFLDYSTLGARRQFCLLEFELNRRFAPQLYCDVVAVTRCNSDSCSDQSANIGFQSMLEGAASPWQYMESPDGIVLEYAIVMRRFAQSELLAQRLLANNVQRRDIASLAEHIADFHANAIVQSDDGSWGSAEGVLQDQRDNIVALREASLDPGHEELLVELTEYIEASFVGRLSSLFRQRLEGGYIRACHGDLHAENVVDLGKGFVPFDGIEFSERLRWIDTQNDLAFLTMDLESRGHRELAAIAFNTYLEKSGDYFGLQVLRWYQIYRAMVRAKVAGIRRMQESAVSAEYQQQTKQIYHYLELAVRLKRQWEPSLTITHGVSGSGKTTGTEKLVEQGAIRVRSDVERKRLARMGEIRSSLYSAEATEATYRRLLEVAEVGLDNGYAIVVDATFLRRCDRKSFQELAEIKKVPFRIAAFAAPQSELVDRLRQRKLRGGDASDADETTLPGQFEKLEPLLLEEQAFIV